MILGYIKNDIEWCLLLNVIIMQFRAVSLRTFIQLYTYVSKFNPYKLDNYFCADIIA